MFFFYRQFLSFYNQKLMKKTRLLSQTGLEKGL